MGPAFEESVSFYVKYILFSVRNDSFLPKWIGGHRKNFSPFYYFFVSKYNLHYLKYDSNQSLIEALDNGRLETIVADAPILKYLIKEGKDQERYTNLSVLPYQLQKENFGFALQENSPIEERLNQTLLDVRKSIEWTTLLN